VNLWLLWHRSQTFGLAYLGLVTTGNRRRTLLILVAQIVVPPLLPFVVLQLTGSKEAFWYLLLGQHLVNWLPCLGPPGRTLTDRLSGARLLAATAQLQRRGWWHDALLIAPPLLLLPVHASQKGGGLGGALAVLLALLPLCVSRGARAAKGTEGVAPKALLAAAVAGGSAFLLADQQRVLSAFTAAVAVGLFTWAGLWYVALFPLLVLPFARGDDVREWLALALLCSGVPALAYVRWPNVLLDGRLLFARFIVAAGGWLLAAGGVALWHDGSSRRLLLVPIGLVALAFVLRVTRRGLVSSFEVTDALGPFFRGVATLAGFSLAASLAVALHPRADAFRRGLWYPMGNRDLVLRLPPLPPPPWHPPRPRLELPSAFRGEPEPEDDPNVRDDTQSWCLMHHRRGAMIHVIHPRTRRWEQLRFFYREGDKAAACNMERLIRQAVPERGYCTLEHVYDLARECQNRSE
ncbi:MAG: hypothetical protein K0R38_6798, partial [Polyangiaceae bacterium]|nr:hypothetical protein [Polyangiaceae bacterium]